MIDIDFFKKYNDTYGHLQGDTCLKLVAGAIQRSVCRPRDMVARFGGEEFVVILPDTGSAGACHVADIIMENVSLLDMEHRASAVSGNVTVSMGIAVMVPDKDEPSSKLLDMADIALYNAKHEGRNCYKASVQKEIF
jgi:diguanylate cyclase (GGDEF)-like protein